MIVAIASGKGGAGKTTVALNMAWCAPEPALLLDCDVEAPNCHLFLQAEPRRVQTVRVCVPELDPALCTGCGACVQRCEFSAVALLRGRPLFFPELCHACGGCALACPTGALREVERGIGTISVAPLGPCTLIQGRLEVGSALSPPVIRAVKRLGAGDGLTIVDCPPGLSCPLVAALSGCDFVVAVAEPTPFGRHDLGLLVETLRHLGLPFGVVINRAGPGASLIAAFCRDEGLTMLAELPESRELASAHAAGRVAAEGSAGLRALMTGLWRDVLEAPAGAAQRERGSRNVHG